MNALTVVDWPVVLAFAGGACLGMLVGYVLGLWRGNGDATGVPAPGAETGVRRAATARAERPAVSAARPAPTAGDGAFEAWAASRRPVRAAAPPPADWADDGEGPIVLLVDDRLELLAVHAAYLRQHGYRTLLAQDGATGLAFARAYHPALIVLDHSMPDRTGVEVARELKADAATAGIPIVLMTALSYGAVGAAATAAGCAAFLPKPVEPTRLLREIEARTPRH